MSIESGNTILVAISGGKDSVALAHILLQLDYKIHLVHCNFKLRSDESDGDELYVRQLAKEWKVPISVKSFDVAQEKWQGESTQMTARRIRYDWFAELLQELKLKYLATGHSANDQAETILYNFIRGAGISGMRGILPNNGQFIRPLLFAESAEIIDYNMCNGLVYREDSSNKSTKYNRNRIRHVILNEVEQINPGFVQSITHHHERFRKMELLLNETADFLKKEWVTIKDSDHWTINFEKLSTINGFETILFKWMEPFGFNYDQINTIVHAKNLSAEVITSSHRIIKNRKTLTLSKKEIQKGSDFFIDQPQGVLFLTDELKIKWQQIQAVEVNPKLLKTANHAFLDFSKLKFPLQIRIHEDGDRFKPFGMKGHQKLSDFFINHKLSQTEKENTFLLLSENEIAWVCGYRIGNDFKILPATNQVLHLELQTDRSES